METFWDIIVFVGSIVGGIITLAFIGMFGYWVGCIITDKIYRGVKGIKYKGQKIIPWAFFILFIAVTAGYFGIKIWWGNNTIGSWFCKNEFYTSYYVRVSPNNSLQEYFLRADIHSYIVEDYGRANIIEKIYWPNGGYLYFEDYDYYVQAVTFDDPAILTDQNGSQWYVKLTREKVN